MTTTPPPNQDRTWCDALEDLQTIQGGFVGLALLLRNQDDGFDPYQLAKVAMIIEVLNARFQVLLDTAIGGMLALRGPSARRPAATAPHAAEGEDA